MDRKIRKEVSDMFLESSVRGLQKGAAYFWYYCMPYLIVFVAAQVKGMNSNNTTDFFAMFIGVALGIVFFAMSFPQGRKYL